MTQTASASQPRTTRKPIKKAISKQETRSDASRQKILEAAVRIIQSGDLALFSVRSICKEAGLSTGAFYHLFNSKEDVINYYLKYTFQQYKKDIAAEDEGETATDKILTLYRYMVECYAKAGPAFLSYFYVPTNPILDYRNRPNDEHMILEEVDEFLTQGQEEGFLLPDFDHDQALLNIGAIVTGIMFYWCVFDGNVNAAELVEARLTDYLRHLEA